MDGYLAWLRSRVGHDKIQLVFAVACVVRDGEVLLQQRADTGGWGFPGGALELGEAAHDAAVRETREETGVSVAVTRLIGVYTDYEQRYPNGDLAQPILIAFRAVPLTAEHQLRPRVGYYKLFGGDASADGTSTGFEMGRSLFLAGVSFRWHGLLD